MKWNSHKLISSSLTGGAREIRANYEVHWNEYIVMSKDFTSSAKTLHVRCINLLTIPSRPLQTSTTKWPNCECCSEQEQIQWFLLIPYFQLNAFLTDSGIRQSNFDKLDGPQYIIGEVNDWTKFKYNFISIVVFLGGKDKVFIYC